MARTMSPPPGGGTPDVTGFEKSSAQRQQLYAAYMEALCGPELKLTKNDFLARGADPQGKGDFQGCSEFNPVVLFSREEDTKFQGASDKTERNAENAPNRRVMVLLFRPGSQVVPARWPCPRAKEGVAGCRKRFWSDGEKRRGTRLAGQRRLFETSKDTFACRFYHRLTDTSPCEKLVKLATLKKIVVKLPTTQSARGQFDIAPSVAQHEFSSTSTSTSLDTNKPITLVRNCKDLQLEAETDPPGDPNVQWTVEPNPGPDTPRPVLSSAVGSKVTLKTDATGGFAVKATLGDTTLVWNLVLVDITIDSSQVLTNSTNFVGTVSGTQLRVSSGVFNVAAPATCGMFAKAVITLSAGGQAALAALCDKVHVGIPNNLNEDDTAAARYSGGGRERERAATVAGLPNPVVDPATVVVELGTPVLDRGGPQATRATGGNTIFLVSTRETPATGVNRTVETCDSPGVAFDRRLPEFGKAATQTVQSNDGTNAFKIYLVAFSDDAKFSYVAFGEARWTADYSGTVGGPAAAPVWTATTAGVTGPDAVFNKIVGGKEAQAAGCEVCRPTFLDNLTIDAR